MEPISYTHLEYIHTVEMANGKFAILWKEKVFYVGELLFKVVQWLKEGKEMNEVQSMLSVHHNIEVSVDKLHTIIEEGVFKKITDSEINPKSSYIKSRIRLVGEEKINSLSTLPAYLFEKKVFVLLLVVALGVHIWFGKLLLENSLFSHRITLKDGLMIGLFNYLCLFLVGFIHEIGHTAAAKRYGVSSKEIGLGFYFIIPVLYADVSKVWILDKYKRLVVNIGGIYFQVLVNIPLLVVFIICHRYFKTYEWIPASLFLTNLAMAMRSLNPFFRNDGYWIYSDFFELTNLSAQTNTFPTTLYQIVRKRKKITSVKQLVGLGIYSMVKYALMCMLPVWLFASVHQMLSISIEFISTGGYIHNQSLLQSCLDLGRVGFSCTLAVIFNFKLAKTYYFRLQKIRGKYTAPIEEVAI